MTIRYTTRAERIIRARIIEENKAARMALIRMKGNADASA